MKRYLITAWINIAEPGECPAALVKRTYENQQFERPPEWKEALARVKEIERERDDGLCRFLKRRFPRVSISVKEVG